MYFLSISDDSRTVSFKVVYGSQQREPYVVRALSMNIVVLTPHAINDQIFINVMYNNMVHACLVAITSPRV